MLSADEKKELLNKLNEKKEVIIGLRSKLNELGSQKEHWYRQRGAIYKEIHDKALQLNDSKNKRDELTSTAKTTKEQRDTLNKKITEKIAELKQVEAEKEEVMKEHNIKGSPAVSPAIIKKEIERLEFYLETSVMSFEREKELMKKINELKKRYKETSKVSAVWKKMRMMADEIGQMKKEADLFYRKLRVEAGQSHEKHETLIETSKMIMDLRKKKYEAEMNFVEFKKQFKGVNAILKEEFKQLNEISEKLGTDKDEARKIKKANVKRTLEEKKKAVDEKLKTGKKLTTEDILAFQSDILK